MERFIEIIKEGNEGYDIETVIQNLTTEQILDSVEQYVMECCVVTYETNKITIL